MTFRFIHTADVHLDSPLETLALKDAEAADVVANATRQAFSNTIDLCIDERVDALMIAGDLYDGELKSMKTAAFFTGEMHRVAAAGVRVFIIRGNHDAESRITKHLTLPDGVHVFSGRGESVTIDESGVVIHGISFAKPHVPESLLAKYKPAVNGAINIGLLHTSLAGSTKHDVYSPCSVQQLKDQGYDYWALGHIHQREVHTEAPNAIVMPGILQGRHINEAGPKSVTYVEIRDNREILIEERHTSIAQFERVPLDLTGVDDWSEIAGALELALNKAVESLKANHLIARIQLRGCSSLSARMRRDRDVLIEEVRMAALRSGSIFIEDVLINVEPPLTPVNASLADPVSELRQILTHDGADQSLSVADAMSLMTNLQKDLPPELRDVFGEDEERTRKIIEHFMSEGAAEVLARLEVAESDT